MLKSLYFIILMVGISTTIPAQSLNLAGLEKLTIDEHSDTTVKQGLEIKRTDKKEVILMFLQDFEDTVLVYENDVLLMNQPVRPQADLIISEYTGVSVSHRFVSNKSVVTIIYKNRKKYLQFRVNNEFPLYTIYVLADSEVYGVSARKNQMIIE